MPLDTKLSDLNQKADAVLALRKAANPGPWDCDEGQTPFYNDMEGKSCGGIGNGSWEVFNKDGDAILLYSPANAAFIASAHDMADLIASYKALAESQAARVEGLERALHKIAWGTVDTAPPYRGLGTSGPVRDIAVAALAGQPAAEKPKEKDDDN